MRPASSLALLLAAAGLLASCQDRSASPGAATTAPARPVLSITACGAVADGATLATAAIQRAIDQVSAAGGGTVVIPAGTFRSGSIFLAPGVDLRLDRDAVLAGSTDIADYPLRPTRIEGHIQPWRMALVNAQGVDHLRIGGDGILDGDGAPFWTAFCSRIRRDGSTRNLDVQRPRLLFIDHCHDVRVDSITLRDSGFWNLHLYACSQVLLAHLHILITGLGHVRAPSTDGMDIDSSHAVRIHACTFAVDDDCIAIKGTKGPQALADAASPPDEDIQITDCHFVGGHAAVTCGSEATIVRHVLVDGCTVSGRMPALRLKLRPDTPQHYSDITVRNLTADDPDMVLLAVVPWTQYFALGSAAPPSSRVDGICFAGVRGRCDYLGSIQPTARTLIDGVTFRDVVLTVRQRIFPCGPVQHLQLDGVLLNGAPLTAATAIPPHFVHR